MKENPDAIGLCVCTKLTFSAIRVDLDQVCRDGELAIFPDVVNLDGNYLAINLNPSFYHLSVMPER